MSNAQTTRANAAHTKVKMICTQSRHRYGISWHPYARVEHQGEERNARESTNANTAILPVLLCHSQDSSASGQPRCSADMAPVRRAEGQLGLVQEHVQGCDVIIAGIDATGVHDGMPLREFPCTQSSSTCMRSLKQHADRHAAVALTIP